MEKNNIVQFGLSEVAIAMKTGEATYSTPIPIPGAVSLSTDPEGSSEKFYADDSTYYSIVTNDGYTGELEVALVPDEVKESVFGWETDKNGALVEIADAIPKPFCCCARSFTLPGSSLSARSTLRRSVATPLTSLRALRSALDRLEVSTPSLTVSPL